MKKTYILKTILLAAVAMTSAACITDAPWRGGEPKPADGKVTFRISVPKNPTPATRALSAEQEYGIGSDDIGVLMFKAASPNEFVGHFEGVVVDGPDPIALTDGGASMMFEATLPMGGSYNLMVVANAGSILTLHSDLLVAGKTQAEVESGLLASMGAAGWNTGANPDLIPMWGYAKGVSIDDFTEVTGSQSYMFREDDPLDLVRMLARVDVKLNATLAAATAVDDPETKRFVLQSVRIYNYSTSGRLIPDTNTATNGGFDWTKVDEPDDLYPTKSYFEVHQTASLPADYTRAPSTQPIVKTVSGSALERDIYLFETTAGVRPTPASTDYWNNPCLVIGGSYMGGETTYYRIDFAKPVSEESDTWEYLQLKRNNRYTVIIQDVDSSGAIDPAEALKSIPANVDADIIEWRGESDIKILLTDNLYMLGLSHDSFTFARSAQTTASEGNHLTVVTDYHSGWSATVSGSATEITSVTGGWLTLNLNGTGGTSVSESTPNRSTTGGTPIDIILAAQPAGAAGSRTAWVHVRAGNMSYAVKVTQLPKDPGLKIVDAVTGEEITQLPFPTTGATEKSFRVEWSPANVALDVIAVRDVREFRWTDADNTCGNTTLTDPDGNYTYRITPDNIADPNDPMEMFNRYGTRLIFVLPGSSPVIKKEIHLTQGTSFDALALSLDPIPSPAPVTWQGTTPSQQREFTVRSHITGTPSGGGEPVTVGVPWKVEYWIDGVWSATAPAWLGNIPAAWEYPAGEDTKTVGYNISQATPAEAGPGMKGKDEIGSQARPYNLSNPPSGSPDAVVNTANCYVIDTPGWYSLPLVYGNAIKGSAPNPDSYSWNHPTATWSQHLLKNMKRHDGGNITAPYITDNFPSASLGAALLWDDVADADLITDVSISGTDLVFRIPKATIVPGNAVVALKDGNTVMWSWHIWVTDLDVSADNVDQVGSVRLMKSNLGWINGAATDTYDARSVRVRISQTIADGESRQFTITSNGMTTLSTVGYNPYYQWGRKDPIPAGRVGYNRDLATSVQSAISNPLTFFHGTAPNQYNEPWDWYGYIYLGGGSGSIIGGPNAPFWNLWNSANTRQSEVDGTHNTSVVKTVYDPSPVGFKVPHPGAIPTNGTWNGTDRGYWLGAAFFPATGRINCQTTSGSLVDNGTRGFYWTASPGIASRISPGYEVWDVPGAISFEFTSYQTRQLERYRADAYPVRPMRDE